MIPSLRALVCSGFTSSSPSLGAPRWRILVNMQGVKLAGGYFDSLIAYQLPALETAGPDCPGVEVRVEALLAPVTAFRVAARPPSISKRRRLGQSAQVSVDLTAAFGRKRLLPLRPWIARSTEPLKVSKQLLEFVLWGLVDDVVVVTWRLGDAKWIKASQVWPALFTAGELGTYLVAGNALVGVSAPESMIRLDNRHRHF